MPGQRSYANTWVIVEVRRQQFALPATSVREIITMPDITLLPARRPMDRGVINLRGRILPLIDMRRQLGWQSVPEEVDAFCKMMSQREQDHRNWLNELETSAVEGTEFRLATDPHKCAFGRWYYSYRPESPWIGALLKKFESPHNQIHALAASVAGLVKAGKAQEALGLMEQARNRELQAMISLFQQLRELVRESAKELAMVITTCAKTFAISIDHAVAVESISPDLIREVQLGALSAGCARKVAQRTIDNSLAIIVEPDIFDVPALG